MPTMSEAHDRFENNRDSHPAWIVERRSWCVECMVPNCGCPTAERLEAERMKHWDGMGAE